MTNKTTRLKTAAITRAVSKNSFWRTVANYANELAPVAGALLDAIGQTAIAVDRAQHRNQCLDGEFDEHEWDK
jgi:hypothetical protein